MTTNVDFVLNGAAHGNAGRILAACNGDVHALRPWMEADGSEWIQRATGYDDNGEPIVKPFRVHNSGAVLRKNEWQRVDNLVVKAAKRRLRLINDLRGAGLTLNLPNAFGTAVLQYERQSDISRARIGMDVTPSGDNDRPTYDIVNLPLPIISKEVQMSSRSIAISRNGNTPLDTTLLELAAEKVAEEAEQLVLGTLDTYTYGGGVVYGLTNFPNRGTGAFLNPNVSGWTPQMLYNSVIKMIDDATNNYHYGPYSLYYSTGLMQYMLQDYSAQYSGTNLENKIRALRPIASVEMLDYLTGNQLVLVHRSPNTVRVVMGMDVTTVQWTENGGAREHFRVMAMMVPQMKTDINGECGIIHYTGNATTAS